jgi:hypothetical protein
LAFIAWYNLRREIGESVKGKLKNKKGRIFCPLCLRKLRRLRLGIRENDSRGNDISGFEIYLS